MSTMKYDGINVAKNADGSVDRDALYLEWLEKDTTEQPARFTAFEKGFNETMAIKGAWFPVIHEALLGFLRQPQYQQSWLPLTLTKSMIFGSMLQNGKIAFDKAAGLEDLIAEYIESLCGDSLADPEALLFSEGKKKGKGVSIKFRLNPKYREALNAPAAAPPGDEPAAG